MKKLEMHSESLINENIAKLAELFPECVTEVVNDNNKLEKQVDFDVFKSLFKNSIITENKERYQFTWPGKQAAREEAFIPTDRSLRPCKEESVNFDTTENLYIEGDNLTVLKLLRHTYHGKIKMIYIDPPYNTGNDFVYNDKFKQNKTEYDQTSGEYDELGNCLYSNTAGGGHFHTNWLNMMYPRLLLARDLLAKDGVIFISIDDNEITNLKKICDEIYGESNFIAQIIIKNNPRGRQSDKFIASVHEYLLCYSKNINSCEIHGLPLTQEQLDDYSYTDSNGKYRLLGLRQRGVASLREDRPDMFFPIWVNPTSNEISLSEQSGWEKVTPKKSDGRDGRWMWGKQKCINEINRLVPRLISRRNEYDIFVKDYLNKTDSEPRTRKYQSIWDSKDINNQVGTQEVKKIFDNKEVMSFPKSCSYIQSICNMGTDGESIILDFFSGSATTAHAVMKLNSEDGGHRKFIMVQIPEFCDDKSEAYKAGYKNICEIGKERIRRAGKQILDELKAKNEGSLFEDKAKLDVGFRVFKQSDSMLADLSVKPEEADQLTFKQMSSKIKNDRTPEDLLFYSMLELGVPLSEKIELISIGKHTLFRVENANLIACFEQEIDEAMVTEVAKMNPDYFILREDAMDDSLINNIDSIFKVYSKNADVEDRIRIL